MPSLTSLSSLLVSLPVFCEYFIDCFGSKITCHDIFSFVDDIPVHVEDDAIASPPITVVHFLDIFHLYMSVLFMFA